MLEQPSDEPGEGMEKRKEARHICCLDTPARPSLCTQAISFHAPPRTLPS
jgi:hypothetical protein